MATPLVDKPEAAARAAGVEPDERERVLAAADLALRHRIDLLGSGPVDLGEPVDWHRDPGSGRRWPLVYGTSVDYANLDEPSDVKAPVGISVSSGSCPPGRRTS